MFGWRRLGERTCQQGNHSIKATCLHTSQVRKEKHFKGRTIYGEVMLRECFGLVFSFSTCVYVKNSENSILEQQKIISHPILPNLRCYLNSCICYLAALHIAFWNLRRNLGEEVQHNELEVPTFGMNSNSIKFQLKKKSFTMLEYHIFNWKLINSVANSHNPNSLSQSSSAEWSAHFFSRSADLFIYF